MDLLLKGKKWETLNEIWSSCPIDSTRGGKRTEEKEGPKEKGIMGL